MRSNRPLVQSGFVSGSMLFLFFLFLSSGCSRQEKKDPSITGEGKSACLKPDSINPNGTSELAKLMREMHVHAARLRDSIANGKPIDTYPVSFETMYTAKATEPKVRSIAFDGFTAGYLTSVKNIYSVGVSSRRHAFNNMVDMCITCHDQYCTGPVKTIMKLKISEAGL
jgi:hypothetical protein